MQSYLSTIKKNDWNISMYCLSFYYNSYFIEIFHYSLICFFFFIILFIIALSFSIKRVEYEKMNSYECGFEPFETNTVFNIHFYIIGLSFLIFDLEIIFLYPWILFASILSYTSFLILLIFLFIVIFGFIYEWLIGMFVWL
jgi:NADH-quinone oxidoreductase subunit A